MDYTREELKIGVIIAIVVPAFIVGSTRILQYMEELFSYDVVLNTLLSLALLLPLLLLISMCFSMIHHAKKNRMNSCKDDEQLVEEEQDHEFK